MNSTREGLLKQITDIENNIIKGLELARQGYNCDTLLDVSKALLEHAKKELSELN